MDRIVDIATDGRHLSLFRGFMVVSEERVEVGRVALEDIAGLIIHAHGVTLTASLVAALAERGAPVVFCGSNHAPKAVCLPLEGHHAINERQRSQLSAGKPLMKQLWRRIVIAKIAWQAAALESVGQPRAPLDMMMRRVGSGDPSNLEAQAARYYWPKLMGQDFRRDRAQEGLNAMLNYGYTVQRALFARSVAAAGLNPTLGIHHTHRANAFALADDLMEPLRPLVDLLALRLHSRGVETVTAEAKRAFAALTALDLPGEAGITTVRSAALRTAQTLSAAFQAQSASVLVLATPPSSLELAGLDALVT